MWSLVGTTSPNLGIIPLAVSAPGETVSSRAEYVAQTRLRGSLVQCLCNAVSQSRDIVRLDYRYAGRIRQKFCQILSSGAVGANHWQSTRKSLGLHET